MRHFLLSQGTPEHHTSLNRTLADELDLQQSAEAMVLAVSVMAG
jgi:hypothetical protein